MTHEQSNRESQEAAKIRESMLAQIYDKVQDVMSGPLAAVSIDEHILHLVHVWA